MLSYILPDAKPTNTTIDSTRSRSRQLASRLWFLSVLDEDKLIIKIAKILMIISEGKRRQTKLFNRAHLVPNSFWYKFKIFTALALAHLIAI